MADRLQDESCVRKQLVILSIQNMTGALIADKPWVIEITDQLNPTGDSQISSSTSIFGADPIPPLGAPSAASSSFRTRRNPKRAAHSTGVVSGPLATPLGRARAARRLLTEASSFSCTARKSGPGCGGMSHDD